MQGTSTHNALLHEARALLRSQDMGVLATHSPDGGPHTSLMAYAVDTDSDTIYMITQAESRKANNLRQNPRASLLADTRLNAWDRQAIHALTANGTTVLEEHGPERDRLRTLLAERHPHLGALLQAADLAVIVLHAESYMLLRSPTDATYIPVEQARE